MAATGGSGAVVEDAAGSTKTKLKSMTDGLDDFGHLLSNASRQKREKDEHRLTELKSSVAIVERTLASETAKRIELGAAMQSWADTQLKAISARLDAALATARTETSRKIDELNARVTKLEETFAKDKGDTMADVSRKNEALVASLKEFNAAFEAERLARMEREQKLLARLAAYEHDSIKRFDDERHEREQVYMAAKRKLEEGVATRHKEDDKFQCAALEEIAAIKNGLVAEEKKRAAEDDEIAETLNAYVQKLQASLALMLSEDATY